MENPTIYYKTQQSIIGFYFSDISNVMVKGTAYVGFMVQQY